MPTIDVAAVDPHSVSWGELGSGSKGVRMQFLRLYPGRWFPVGTKAYKGGFSYYTQQGFHHAVRRADGGGWEHFLRWPDGAES